MDGKPWTEPGLSSEERAARAAPIIRICLGERQATFEIVREALDAHAADARAQVVAEITKRVRAEISRLEAIALNCANREDKARAADWQLAADACEVVLEAIEEIGKAKP